MKKYTFILFLLNVLVAHTQDFQQGKGKAVIYFESNTEVIVRLDTLLLQQTTNPISLSEGTYILKAWAPTKKLFIDTIKIKESQTTIVTHRLEKSEEHIKYKKNLSKYKIKKTATRFIPIPLTLGYSAYMINRYNQNKKQLNSHLDNANRASTNYENAATTEDLNRYKLEYDTEKSNYESCRNKNNQIAKTATISISVAAIASAGLFYLSKKFIKPEYSETPLLSLNTITLNSDYSYFCSIGIIVNINK